jgi:hypothetical protein
MKKIEEKEKIGKVVWFNKETNIIKVGLICFLLSGSPKMTIAEICGNDLIKAVYFVGNDYCEITLSADCFLIIEE